jgi:hypothetical protein
MGFLKSMRLASAAPLVPLDERVEPRRHGPAAEIPRRVGLGGSEPGGVVICLP